MFLVRPQTRGSRFSVATNEFLSILKNRSLIALGAMFIGVQVANEGTAGFVVFFLQEHLKLLPETAGLIGSLNFVGALLGSVVGGRLYDKLRHLRLLMLFFAVLLVVGVAINFLESVYATVCGVLLVGFAGIASLTVLSTAAGKAATKKEYATLAVNYVHGMGLIAAFWAPIMFSSLVSNAGYSLAWIVTALVSFAFIISMTMQKALMRRV
jgi:MFS family permease